MPDHSTPSPATAPKLKCDYLVVGAGAVGIAFVDELLSASDKTVIMIDAADRVGGHWNHAYPFVRLHQPSSFYGVSSLELGQNVIETSGLNAGLRELATRDEILEYFDRVVSKRFVPSGRVQLLLRHLYVCDGTITDLTSGQRVDIDYGTLVDATLSRVQVPATHPPEFPVAETVRIEAPNVLGDPATVSDFDAFVVLGAGKTSFDAILRLLDLGIDPAVITWVKPREAWLFDRANAQPDGTFPNRTMAQWMGEQLVIAGSANSLGEFLAMSERAGSLVRIDETVEPTMFRCATVSLPEVEQLRRIADVVRMGRVVSIGPSRIYLEAGSIALPGGALVINATTDGLVRQDVGPIFREGRIDIQPVRACQQIFSAAFLGFLEALPLDLAAKNAWAVPRAHPDGAADYAEFMHGLISVMISLSTEPTILAWLQATRLDPFVTEEFAAMVRASQSAEGGELQGMVDKALGNLARFARPSSSLGE